MSELRNQLDQARHQHQHTRYPGDLAADLLGISPTRLGYATSPRRPWLFWTNLGTLGAIAATIAIVLWRQPAIPLTTPTDKPPTLAIWQPRDADEFSIVPHLAGATLTPQDGGIIPPALPSFPSMTDMLNSATTTTDTTNTNQENT